MICFHSTGSPWTTPMKPLRKTSMCASSAFCVCAGRLLQALSALASLTSRIKLRSCRGSTNNLSIRCTGASPRLWIVLFILYLIISAAAQNNGMDFTYPMGIDRKNLTYCSSLSVSLDTTNTTEGITFKHNHRRIYTSARSTSLRKVGISLGSTANMHSKRKFRDLPNLITYSVVST